MLIAVAFILGQKSSAVTFSSTTLVVNESPDVESESKSEAQTLESESSPSHLKNALKCDSSPSHESEYYITDEL